MPFRKTIFWTHLCIGLAAGLVVGLMALTGVLLTYELQISNWANRGYWQAPPAADSQRLPVSQLLAAVAQDKSTPTGITFQNDPAAPAAVAFGRGRTVYVNPYTAAVLGEGSPRVRSFFRTVTDLHRWLALSGEWRTTGRAITGACNLAFLFLVISGFYLWWPRKWSVNALKSILLFQPRLRGKARDWNWHHVIGFWCWGPLLIIVASGVVISYPWAGNLLHRIAGETPPASPTGGRPQPAEAKPGRMDPSIKMAGVDQALRVAQQHSEGWRSVSLMMPQSAESPLVFTLDHGTGRQPQKRSQLTLSRGGDVIRWEPFASQSMGRRLRALARFGHTGEAAGILGQSIAGLASAGTLVLVWTGFALSWRRLIPTRRRAMTEISADVRPLQPV
jgi:uncharacterized iron-regulated membrane protein